MPNRPNSAQAVFTRLWVPAQPTVASFVFSSVRDTHRAEDVLQEVAAAAIDAFETYNSERPFLPWVLGIARHRVLNYYRTCRGEKLVFTPEALEVFGRAHATVGSEESIRRHALDSCIEKVDERKRSILWARYAEGRSVKQIAEAKTMTANAVSLLLHKLRKALAECVEARIDEEKSR